VERVTRTLMCHAIRWVHLGINTVSDVFSGNDACRDIFMGLLALTRLFPFLWFDMIDRVKKRVQNGIKCLLEVGFLSHLVGVSALCILSQF
jgi:hypothetical protein